MRIFGAVLLWMLALAPAVPAAVTWHVVENADCTGLRAATAGGIPSAAVNCCTAAAGGFCNRRMTHGEEYQVAVYAIGESTYTAPGGDALLFAEVAKLQMGTITYATCNLINNGVDPPTAIYLPILRRTSPLPTIELLTAANTEVANGTDLTGAVLNCLVYGF